MTSNGINNGVVTMPTATMGTMNDTEPEVEGPSSPPSTAESNDNVRVSEPKAPDRVVGAIPPQPPTEVRSLAVVIRAYARHHVRSLMFKRLADVALQEFRGLDGRPPTKLFRMPNGAKFQVDPDDSLELCMDLHELANEERLKMAEIRDAAVHVDAAAVDIPPVPYVPSVPAEDDGDAVDNPGLRVAAGSLGTKSSANGTTAVRPPPTPKATEWEQAVGVSSPPK
jgi:hypothetical protein